MKPKYKHLAVITASTIGLTGLASAANFGDEKYTYDGSGNIIEKSINGQVTKMAYDGSNKVISIDSATKGGESINYDAAGRPVSYKDAAGQAIRQLSYGYADKVLKADNAGSEAEFFYNAEGQLVGKTVGGKLTPYTWDGNVLAAEGADAFTNEAHISGGVPILAGQKQIITSDHLGNTLATGEKSLTSTAYGEGQEQARFTGKLYVKELGNYVFAHRNYDPQTSRWTVADPTGFPDGINSRSYVSGDPLSKLDPSGLSEVDYPDTTLTPGNYGIKVQVKITWDVGNVPAKAPGSDKLVGAVANLPNTTPIFTWTSPNTVVSFAGNWNSRTEGNPPIRLGWYEGVELDADATFTLNSVADTKKDSYSYTTHHIEF